MAIGGGKGRKKTPEAYFTSFRRFGSSWGDGMLVKKLLDKNYKGKFPHMQNNTNKNVL